MASAKAILGLLGSAAIVTGIGLAIRLYAEVTTLREGADLTAWEVGDRIDESDDEDTPGPD